MTIPKLIDRPELARLIDTHPGKVKTAVHESGHLAALSASGRIANMVSIEKGEQASSGGGVWPSHYLGGVDQIRANMVMLASGAAAETIFDPSSSPSDEIDNEQLRAEGWRLVGKLGSFDQVDQEVRMAHIRANKLIRHLWPHVLALMEVLLLNHERSRAIPYLGCNMIETIDEMD